MADPMSYSAATRLTSVLLVDDHELVRRGVRCLLEKEPELQVIADVPFQPAPLSIAKAEQPDVIVVEPDTLEGSDIALGMISDVLIEVPQCKVLILTDLRDPHQYTRFLTHGALGLVLKHQPAEVLVKAIKKLREGEVWLERTRTARLLRIAAKQHLGGRAFDAQIRTLTKREREIITWICQGLRNGELGNRLFISEATVRNHVTSILHKLGLANRFELVVFAFQHNIVEPNAS
jgi:two-component system response regulator DevR